jgi:hypothetical protein
LAVEITQSFASRSSHLMEPIVFFVHQALLLYTILPATTQSLRRFFDRCNYTFLNINDIYVHHQDAFVLTQSANLAWCCERHSLRANM